MCMSEAVRILDVTAEGDQAVVELRGARRRLSIALLTLEGQTVEPGDWVLTSAGVALEKIDEEAAMELQEFLDAARRREAR